MDKILKDALKSQFGFPTPVTVALLVAATDIVTSLLLARMELGQTARVAIALLPIPANVWLIAIILRTLRRLDEFLKRIQFEAVAVAFLTTGVAVENGKYDPALPLAFRISRAFGKNVEEVFIWEEPTG